MASITLQNITKQFGTRIVLQGVNLQIPSGETIGLVGPNGAGKTTLFRLITGELEPDYGTITRTRGLEIGYLEQEPDVALERTLHDEVGEAFQELLALEHRIHAVADEMSRYHDQEHLPELMETLDRLNNEFAVAGGHTFEQRLNEILGGLGFAPADYETPLSALSGGQRCRAALAKLLLTERPFLLLDEPTNHLDIDAVRWLEKFLASHRGGAVVISHDRYLLDRVCQRIVEVDQARLFLYPGNYTNYMQTKELRILTQERQFEKDSEFIRKERDFIARFLAGQRSKEAQGRRTRLERQLAAGEFVTSAPTQRRSARIGFQKVETKGGTILRCDDLDMAYGEKKLFADMSFQVYAGDRLGITGPNGTGKTTLLKIILGQVAPIGGTFELDPGKTIGYYSQDHADLDPQRSVLAEIQSVTPVLPEQQARSYLGRFLFVGDTVFKTVSVLSGGEQSRLRLAKLILQKPDMLILDEPTNHLDIPSREALEDALAEFGGTIITISHDRYFLDRVATRLLVIRPAGHVMYAGNYTFYLQQIEAQRTVEQAKTESRKPAGLGRSDRGGKKSRVSDNKPSTSAYDRLSIDELEALVMEKEIELAALNEQYGDPAVMRDPDALAELGEKIEEAATELADVDAAWQERVDTL